MLDAERGALTAAIAALEDMSMVLDGWQLAQIGLDAGDPGARDAASRLRRAAKILDMMLERNHPSELFSTRCCWSPN
ncbi:MAG: hypothetical protein J2P45_29870 [Candidatus Dormibacteraeota bacterium]|nr:hypothetical protein [Candidatus Dormibacteraeota bacterium]